MNSGERRKSIRVEKRIMIRVNERSGMALDISRLGMRISTSMVPVSRKVQISFQAGGNEYDLDGYIVWINKKHSVQNLKEIGIAILNGPEMYSRYVETLTH